MPSYPPYRNIVWTVLFSIIAALSLNGCSDTSSVSTPPGPVPLSPDAKLASLTVNPGPLLPVFSSDMATYTVDVLNTVASVTVTAQPQTAGATVSINGQKTTSWSVPLGAAGSNTPISIVVTAPSGSQNTYILSVNRFGANNANLSNLTVTPGSLSPGFTSNNTGPYTVDVDSTVGSVTVTATKADTNATVSINGVIGTSLTINNLPAAPSTTQVDVLVFAQDGSTSKTYVVNVSRLGANNANLSNLTVTPGSLSPGFTSNNTGPIGRAHV